MIGLDTISDPARPEEDAGGWIVLKIRWVGVILGYIVANAATGAANAPLLNALLAVGLAFTLLDTWFRRRDRIFLGRFPLFISAMEALFIGLLCHFDSGAQSAFRYYYFLSVLCCVLRHGAMVGWLTCLGHI
ncbi:MAG: two-component sensor histidine kinase, partial [Planctomycetota bacterium]